MSDHDFPGSTGSPGSDHSDRSETPEARRFFSAPSLARAVAEAARHHGLTPEELDYHVRDKRHGFVRAPRGVVIEVDPASPRRAPGSSPAAGAGSGAPPTPRRTPGAAGIERADRDPRRERTERRDRPGRGDRPDRPPRGERPGPSQRSERPRRDAGDAEPWAAPDAESELAAAEACSRLLRLAGLTLEARVQRGEERLEIELTGADLEAVAAQGNDLLDLLDRLEQLLPRAVHGLCGRLVRVRVDAAGRRGVREGELRARARAAAAQVLSGDVPEVVLEPLAPAERRIVHLELGELSGVVTESLGDGHRKRVRVSRAL